MSRGLIGIVKRPKGMEGGPWHVALTSAAPSYPPYYTDEGEPVGGKKLQAEKKAKAIADDQNFTYVGVLEDGREVAWP